MNLKIQYSTLFIIINLININSSIAMDPYKEAKDFANVVNRDYVAPTLQPVIIEGRQNYIYKTEHEKRKEEQEQLNLEHVKLSNKNTELSNKSQRATEINTQLNTLLTYCQTHHLGGGKDGDPKCKDYVHRFSIILDKNITKLLEEEEGELTKPVENTVATTKPAEEAKTENNNDNNNKTESNVSNEKPAIEPSPEITTKKENNTQINEKDKQQNKSLIAKLCTILCPPFVVKGIDITAQTCGPHALAHWLGSNSSFFKGKEQIISRSLVVAGAAITCTALYKIYQIFTTEEEESDEFDMFNNFSFGNK